MRIDEFLLARVAEDEAAAALLYAAIRDEGPAPGYHRMVMKKQRKEWPSFWNAWAQCQTPAKLLAECEAKRRVVELHMNWPVLVETPPRTERVEGDDIGAMVLRMSRDISWLTTREYVKRFGEDPPTSGMMLALANIYADHPDFDPAWRP